MKGSGKRNQNLWVSTNIYWESGSIVLSYSVPALSCKHSSIISNSIPFIKFPEHVQQTRPEINPWRHSCFLWVLNNLIQSLSIEHRLYARHYARPSSTNIVSFLKEPIWLPFPVSFYHSFYKKSHVLTHTESRRAYAKSSDGWANLASWILTDIQFVSYLYLCMHLSSIS